MAERGRDEAVGDALVERLLREGLRLGEAYQHGPGMSKVPGLNWTARDVVAHTGAVHRWASRIVTGSLDREEAGQSQTFAPAGPDEGLLDWFREGLDRLVDVLRMAPAELQAFTFVPGVPAREFWIRRQAHETAIHRADVQAANGLAVDEVEAWFARDGLGEVVGAFARQPRFAISRPGRLLLLASDGPSWKIIFDRGGNRVSTGEFADDEGDAQVRGSSDRLYRWAWNRPVPDVEITGDLHVAHEWSQTVRIS